jgi:membrane-anchored mycosin MYCP
MAAAPRQSVRNAWYSSELVVGLEHRRDVLQVLDRWQVGSARIDEQNRQLHESRDLGLALIPLLDEKYADERAAATAVAGLKHDAAGNDAFSALVKKAAGNPDATTVDEAVDAHLRTLTPGMDQLLWAVRAYFAATYEGWMPTLGKNRLVGDVEGGNGHISHGVATSGPEDSGWRPEPPIRPTEPGVGVRVGVLDTSLFPHPWLAGGWVGPGTDRLALQPPYPALAGHGTFVAGLVLRKAPGCVVEFRQVLTDQDATATSWDVAKKIVELGRTGLDVLNLSLACYTEDGQPPLVLATAIDRLDPEIVVVAAAGNHGDVDDPGDRRKPAWPAALDDVVAVGAADDSGILANFTPKDVPWIDVLSNGVKVSSTFLDGDVHAGVNVSFPPGAPGSPGNEKPFPGFATWSGSSFAAALFSGEVAARTRRGSRSAHEACEEVLEERGRLEDADPRFVGLL